MESLKTGGNDSSCAQDGARASRTLPSLHEAPGQAHLHGLYDDGESMVLAVPGQQVLTDATEGEVPVVEALEVGLACDKTLSWKDPEEGVRGEALSWQGGVHIKTGCPPPRVPRCPFPQDNQN